MNLIIESNAQVLYLTLLKHLQLELEWNVNNTDLKVLAGLYTKNNDLKHIKTFEERMTVLFSSTVKKEIADIYRKTSY